MCPAAAPLIGVITDQKPVGAAQRPFTGAYPDYLDCVAAAGGLPVLIPLGLSVDALRGIFERVDGVLLTGGADVDPVLYGETVTHEKVYGISPLRDEAEIRVSRWAAEDDVPLFGICRGHQVVNVALGGTLVMDIPSQINTDIPHDFPDGTPLDIYAHPVAIAPGSRLAGIVGVANLTVNSWHHQSVRQAGQGLVRVGARARRRDRSNGTARRALSADRAVASRKAVCDRPGNGSPVPGLRRGSNPPPQRNRQRTRGLNVADGYRETF